MKFQKEVVNTSPKEFMWAPQEAGVLELNLEILWTEEGRASRHGDMELGCWGASLYFSVVRVEREMK